MIQFHTKAVMKKMWMGTLRTPQHMLMAQFGEAGNSLKKSKKYGTLKARPGAGMTVLHFNVEVSKESKCRKMYPPISTNPMSN
jgi:hypothetical protein